MEENIVDNVEESINTPVQPNNDVIYQPPKSGSRTALKVIIAILVIIILGGVGVFLYFTFMLSNPVKLTAKLLNKVGNDYNDLMDDAAVFYTGEPIKETVTGSINEMSFDLNSGVDLKQKLIQFDAKLGMSGKDVLYVDAEATPEQVVFKLAKDSLNSYLHKDKQLQSVFDALNTSFGNNNKIDLAKVLNYLGSSFEKNYDKSLFKKSTEEISIGSNKIKATKFTTEFTLENLEPTLKDFIQKIIDDKELMKQMASIASASGQEVSPEMLEALLKMLISQDSFGIVEGDDLPDAAKNTSAGTYAIYTKGTDVVGIAIGSGNDLSYIFTYKGTLAFQNAPVSTDGVVYNTKSGDFSYTSGGKLFVSGNFKYTNSKDELNASLSFKIPMLNVDAKLTSKTVKTTSLTKKTFTNPIDIDTSYGEYLFEQELQNNPYFSEISKSTPFLGNM